MQFVRHKLHVRINVIEKFSIASAQIIQAVFAVRRLDETMLRAFTVASEAHFAFAAILRQRVELIRAELLLLGGVHHCQQRIFHDVAELVFRINKMVA